MKSLRWSIQTAPWPICRAESHRVIYQFYKLRITIYKWISCEFAIEFCDIFTLWCLLGITNQKAVNENLKLFGDWGPSQPAHRRQKIFWVVTCLFPSITAWVDRMDSGTFSWRKFYSGSVAAPWTQEICAIKPSLVSNFKALASIKAKTLLWKMGWIYDVFIMV